MRGTDEWTRFGREMRNRCSTWNILHRCKFILSSSMIYEKCVGWGRDFGEVWRVGLAHLACDFAHMVADCGQRNPMFRVRTDQGLAIRVAAGGYCRVSRGLTWETRDGSTVFGWRLTSLGLAVVWRGRCAKDCSG